MQVVHCEWAKFQYVSEVKYLSSPFRPKPGSSTLLTSPYFPMDTLKTLMMELLTEAVQKGAAHIRDPIGGTNATLFVYVFINCLYFKVIRSVAHIYIYRFL